MARIIDLKAQRFGRLLVIDLLPQEKRRAAVWQCVCDCGKRRNVSSSNLRRGYTQSCGCLRIENAKRTILINGDTSTHNMTGSTEYRSWQSMKKRCYDVKDRYFKNYGGRGIKVCDRWVNSFEKFISDMGKKPSPELTLDRYPNKNGNYEPTNCRWATQLQQQNNRTDNRIIEYNGLSLTLTEWSEKTGIKRNTIKERIRAYGWSVEQALTA